MRSDLSVPIASRSLHVYPLGGRLSEGTLVELRLTEDQLIKHERVTVVWGEVPVEGKQAVVKMYRRGLFLQCYGLITSFRVKREFDGLRELEKRGVPCSLPLCWCRGHFGLFGWGEMLVTEWIGENQPLSHLLSSTPDVHKSLDLSSLFADLAIMHAGGLHHGMLRTKNILVKNYPESPTFVVVDLARSHRFPSDVRGKRMARYDLLSLCEGLLPYFPDNTAQSWLSAYGMPESEKMNFIPLAKKFRFTAFLRKALAWEFDVRHAVARLLARAALNRRQ